MTHATDCPRYSGQGPCTCHLALLEESPVPPCACLRNQPCPHHPEQSLVFITYWLELDPGASTDDVVVFTSSQHQAAAHLPVTEWITLGRPGRIETRSAAR